MAQIKAYTDISQSKILSKILPLESADMGWYYNSNPLAARNQMWAGTKAENADIPCWSLAALSEFILPYITDDDGNNYKFYLSKDGLDRWIAYYKSDDVSIHICEESDNMIDVILEMVCWLKAEQYI